MTTLVEISVVYMTTTERPVPISMRILSLYLLYGGRSATQLQHIVNIMLQQAQN